MKAILRSVQPQWMAKILTGEKTVEIGKTMPKCNLPIEVYLYCTKSDGRGRQLYRYQNTSNEYFIDDRSHNARDLLLSGTVAAKFTLRTFDKVWDCGSSFSVPDKGIAYTNRIATASCLDFNDMRKYANGRPCVYAWHISDLVVFDKPMELREFYKPCNVGCLGECNLCIREKLTRPPQTWQYVEVE